MLNFKDEKMKQALKMNNFFSTRQLAKACWFPINAESTIRKLIDNDIIDALNISATGRKRWRISREDIVKYLVKIDEEGVEYGTAR